MDDSQRLVLQVFAVLFGLILGSFLNVVIFRLPRRCMSLARGRSLCPRCRQEIAWYDNVPVVSWVVLGGRCRTCRERISPRYVFVELLTGALVGGAAFLQLYRPDAALEPVERITLFVIHCYLVGAIVASTFIDIDFEILPDEINKSGIAFGIIAGTAFPTLLYGSAEGISWLTWIPQDLRSHAFGIIQAVLGTIVGGGIVWSVSIFGTLLFRKRIRELRMETAMGFGDVMYLSFLGAFLGWKGIGLVFLVSILFGAVYGVGKYVITRSMGKVPFGPFLSVGALAVLFARPWVERALQAYLDLFRSASS